MSVDRNNIIARPCDGGSDQEWTHWSNNQIMNNESELCAGRSDKKNVETQVCQDTKD